MFIISLKIIHEVKDIKRKLSDREIWGSLALYGSLSLNLGLMITGGYFLGHLVEENYHLTNMAITGVLIGIILGLYEMFIVAWRAGQKK